MRQGDTLRTENQEFCTTYNMLKVILFLSSFWSYRVGRHPCRNLGYHVPGSSLSTTIDQYVAFWTDKEFLRFSMCHEWLDADYQKFVPMDESSAICRLL
jgi:hypothetical protein